MTDGDSAVTLDDGGACTAAYPRLGQVYTCVLRAHEGDHEDADGRPFRDGQDPRATLCRCCAKSETCVEDMHAPTGPDGLCDGCRDECVADGVCEP